LNQVILIGNCGKDPEIRSTPSGAQVASFSVATSEKWTDKDGQKHEKTDWANIQAWRTAAEYVEKNVRKGMRVAIVGKLRTSTWEDKDGNKRYNTFVEVNFFSDVVVQAKVERAENAAPAQPQEESVPF
jgi:single-strand DNA-binding protein